MKVALVYDRINKWGGAERVLLALHEMFPEAPIYTSVYNPVTAPWASVFNVKTSFLQKVPKAKSSHEYFALIMPIVFESFNFDTYDLVISVTSESAKGILTTPNTIHICYCLTPTRYLWSGYQHYFSNNVIRFLSKPVVAYLRHWDIIAAQRPDAFIAISKEVQDRIKKYYQRSATILYPPVTLGTQNKQGENEQGKRGDYYLVVSRLVSYKRVDLAIQACNRLQLPLIIVGTGKKEKELQRIAGPTIRFVGNLTDTQLIQYYKGCKALLFPGDEDFGLAIVEAQKFGCPVIAFRGGGAIETIRDGKTGILFSPQTVDALIDAIKVFQGKDKQNFTVHNFGEQVKEFETEVFKKNLMNFIALVKEKKYI